MPRTPLIAAALTLAAAAALLLAPSATAQRESDEAAVHRAVDAFHHAAAVADEETYFGLLTDDARFLGTDESERWSKAQFRDYCDARAAFDGDSAWVYEPEARVVTLGPGARTAWFDEVLTNAKYGRVRGSGVLVRTTDGWKIAQYNLAFTVPNEKAEAVVELIRKD